ncbi:protein tramtrack, beta isoform-like [Tachypleus tridentatus]|uniref:protein tramtrack, beta isoform-like n=1 Tax=Tachypleus tridentatus TaxID=6853 RepID=UPI003FD4114F
MYGKLSKGVMNSTAIENALYFNNVRENKSRGKQYSCRECDASYTDPSSLARHHRVKHAEVVQLHFCNLCSKSFQRKDCLKVHKRTVHKYMLNN